MSQSLPPAGAGSLGLFLAVLCTLCIACNYAARAVIPVVAHSLCADDGSASAGSGCDAAELVGASLSAFFAGDLVAQFSAGPLVRSVRGGTLLSTGTASWALIMLMMPLAVQAPRMVLLLAQAAFGFACGLGYPSSHALVAEAQIDSKYRTSALSLVNSAAGIGSMVSNYITPLTVARISWVSPFLLFSACGLGAAGAVATSQPGSKQADKKASSSRSPLSILSDARLWLQDGLVRGVVITMYLTGVPSFGLVAFIPTLFLERYGLQLSELGMVTAAPPFAQVIVCFGCGALSDHLIRSGRLDTRGCRRLMQLIATAGPACSLLLLASTTSPMLAAVLVTTWLGSHSFWTAGCVALIHDVAKARAGEFFVLGNAFSKFAALLAAPLIRLVLRTFGWDCVLYLTALHYVVAALVLLPRMHDTERAARLFVTGVAEKTD
eukprot:TRINITY_DN35959_c0_g1_i1.p1 TRINITY_DN35959_c0_g1~~TRINITY_DN35959_c0_g1_i1.p1  ORF type:complete len:437 (+),score=76.73 TRINITY_DN35959_c0_g1_i1:30-1340(+)